MKYKSKWSIIGVTKQTLKRLYSKNRIKADTLLRLKYKKEYSILLNNLMNREYKTYSNKNMKGGLKE